MAGKSKRALADEAWERAQQTRLEPPVDLHGELPGQLDISGEIVGESHVTPLPEVSEVPDTCPSCGAGGRGILLWSHMREGAHVQCVKCGYILAVTKAAWKAVRAAARIAFADRTQPPIKRKPKRVRGAE